MVSYRRNFVPGGTYFFTVTLANRSATTLVAHVDKLRWAFRDCREAHQFEILAIVVLPEHLHCVWTLPANDADYPTRWRLIKSTFTRIVGSRAPARFNGERLLWQRRFWEHTVRDEQDLQRHVDYVHFNPVKHGHVSRPADWPHSSLHWYIRQGRLPTDWAVDVGGSAPESGE